MMNPSQFSAGSHYGNFTVQRVRYIKELQAYLYELIHDRLLTRVIYIANEDPENLFCLSFQTFPETSNGVAHVLEHCVLCGSESFPVKDPFFSMTRKSLNTYMNALTGSDFTCYPAASQNEKDFYNLLSVYLDAVFRPKLSELSFAQEGHRLSLEKTAPPSLSIKGIVYNEMKGALSNPITRLMEKVSEALFPSTPYGKNSGGDPKEIPSLSLEELRSFHKKYYHPSKCLFFFYGNIPLEKHLDFIESSILSKTAPGTPPESEPKTEELRKTKPSFEKISYPVDAIDTETPSDYYAISWLTAPITNTLDCLALSILDIVLMNTDAAILKKALLTSRLCRQASSSIDLEIREVPYTLILSGLNEDSRDQLQQIIFETLKSVAEHGIPAALLESALHQVEFERSEIIGDGTPFGLVLYSKAALLAHHGSDPAWGLEIHSLFETLKQRLEADSLYFSKLIHRYFLDNQHRVEVLMTPSAGLAQQEVDEEKTRLGIRLKQLSKEQLEEIEKFNAELETAQEAEDDLSCLPSISISDISPDIQKIPLTQKQYCESSSLRPIRFFAHECFTNNIAYVDIASAMPHVALEELWLVRLFSFLLPQIGTQELAYDQFLEEMQNKTGGISSSLSLNCQSSNPLEFQPSWHLSGKALNRNISSLFHLMHGVITSPRVFDRTRVRDLIEKQYTNLMNSLPSQSMRYATLAANKFIVPAGRIQEEWHGLSYLKKIEQLIKNYDAQEGRLLESLQNISDRFLGSLSDLDIVVSAQADSLYEIENNSFWNMNAIPGRAQPAWNSSIAPPLDHSEGLYTIFFPQQTASAVMSMKSVAYTDHDAPYISLAAHLMDNTILHKRIREQGGAYGAGASYQSSSGLFYWYSYRDPHIASTLTAFSESIQSIVEGEYTEEDLDEAKREIIQGLDSPIAPGSRASIAYTRLKESRSDAMRDRYRKALLSADIQTVQQAAQKMFVENSPAMSRAACTGKELFEKEKDQLAALQIPIRYE